MIDLTALDATTFEINGLGYSLEELLKGNVEIPEYIYLVEDPTIPEYHEIYHFEEASTIDENLGYVKEKPKDKKIYAINFLLAACLMVLMKDISLIYEAIKYRRLEKDVNDKIERLIKS